MTPVVGPYVSGCVSVGRLRSLRRAAGLACITAVTVVAGASFATPVDENELMERLIERLEDALPPHGHFLEDWSDVAKHVPPVFQRKAWLETPPTAEAPQLLRVLDTWWISKKKRPCISTTAVFSPFKGPVLVKTEWLPARGRVQRSAHVSVQDGPASVEKLMGRAWNAARDRCLSFARLVDGVHWPVAPVPRDADRMKRAVRARSSAGRVVTAKWSHGAEYAEIDTVLATFDPRSAAGPFRQRLSPPLGLGVHAYTHAGRTRFRPNQDTESEPFYFMVSGVTAQRVPFLSGPVRRQLAKVGRAGLPR